MYYIIVWVACSFLLNTKLCYNHIYTQCLFSCADHIHILLCTGCTVDDELQACFQAEVINAAMDCNIPEKNLVSWSMRPVSFKYKFSLSECFYFNFCSPAFFQDDSTDDDDGLQYLTSFCFNTEKKIIHICKLWFINLWMFTWWRRGKWICVLCFLLKNWEKVGTASVGL